jgi:hypothetical protein
MSNDRAWDIVTSVIEPLAERLEAASKAAYPAGKVSSVTLDTALMHSHFETGRRLLEFSISPAYARVFQRTIEGPIIRLRRLEYKTRFKTSLRFKQYCRARAKERVDTIGSRGDPASLHLSTVMQAWQPGQ